MSWDSPPCKRVKALHVPGMPSQSTVQTFSKEVSWYHVKRLMYAGMQGLQQVIPRSLDF